ncbi:MAG: hypothetical protein E6017_12005 [Kluyvera cryocrescens]|uniref:hypothetical protein n=1 Tax=Enterobacter roggenkampii TaxID=1812935 RepID=UPI002906740E|nr:hypothetical protein [Kluyvera cryocrescens]
MYSMTQAKNGETVSLFVYSRKDNCFQLRNKASTDYVIEGYGTFGYLLSALIDTMK